MEILHFAYHFISWQVFRLFPLFGYFEWRYYEHLYTSCVRMHAFSIPMCLGYTPRHGTASSYNDSMFNHSRNCQSDFSMAVPLYIYIRSDQISHSVVSDSLWHIYIYIIYIYICCCTSNILRLWFLQIFTNAYYCLSFLL